ncbi:DUF1697 domain-containing protein [Aquimarina sp. BL5]|uniref:DUF1697 domain-containing protein n=1 Tax=Aquimarina sp. BL5 TaxID=1714860 RepID=UPI000E4C3C65|nr:DUF1697 domain-containing protein [Aquimarina sp. BL5]AXT52429.1 DUF1697 domain-containing protein [Aquimarina sp. BL5]RKN05903.1 DUF1697 domain-containing protein [Aquimarina sp. BL5]
MNTYIALLRGINVGGHKKMKMADLKEMLESLGFSAVVTYIQSGNIVFRDASEDIEVLEVKIQTAIKKRFGFDVPVLIITHDTLNEILQKNPYVKRLESGQIDDKKMYFMLLCNQPNSLATAELSKVSFDPEEFIITKNVIYLFAANGYGKTKLHNNFFEKKLNCQTTTRNLRTLSKLLELSFLKK